MPILSPQDKKDVPCPLEEAILQLSYISLPGELLSHLSLLPYQHELLIIRDLRVKRPLSIVHHFPGLDHSSSTSPMPTPRQHL